MSYSRALFATSDKSESNTLCVWQFNDDCTDSKCIGRICNAHNKDDRKIYSLKIKKSKVPSQPIPSIPNINGSKLSNTLPVPTAFDEDENDNDTEKSLQQTEENENENDEEEDEFDGDYSDFVTNLSFCKHVPQYLLSSGKDGTIKLWDCNQLNDNDNDL